MKLSRASFYQAVELPVKAKSSHGNTVSEEVYPGVLIMMVDHIVTISHKDWTHDVIVPTANLRFALVEKFEAPLDIKEETVSMEEFIEKKASKKGKKKIV